MVFEPRQDNVIVNVNSLFLSYSSNLEFFQVTWVSAIISFCIEVSVLPVVNHAPRYLRGVLCGKAVIRVLSKVILGMGVGELVIRNDLVG